MTINIKRSLTRILKNDNRYRYIPNQNDESLHIVAGKIVLRGAETKFQVNIYVYESDNLAEIIVPIYPEAKGFFGPNIDAFHEAVNVINANLQSNVKLVLFPWDNSNQPVLMLTRSLSEVNEKWLTFMLESIKDNYISVRLALDFVITRLTLQFVDNARLKSRHIKLLSSLPDFLENMDSQ